MRYSKTAARVAKRRLNGGRPRHVQRMAAQAGDAYHARDGSSEGEDGENNGA